MKRLIAKIFFVVTPWKAVGEVPRRGIFVGAPHTSYWDFLFTLMTLWNGGVAPRMLIKEEVFVGPVGWFLRRVGGIPVHRAASKGLITQLAEQAKSADGDFLLAIAAEGTRDKREYWKSGFYHLAKETGLPIHLAFVDGPTRTIGFGPKIEPTDDVRADMDLIRAFYADKHGLHPELVTVPRLREEDAAN